MAKIDSLLRIKFILDKTSNRYVKKSTLIEQWAEHTDGKLIANRTLERDIAYIRDELAIDLDYHQGKGYMHQHEDVELFEFLDQIDLFNTINTYKEQKDLVFLDKEAKMTRGEQWRPLLIQSIIKKEYVTFKYIKYSLQSPQNDTRKILPLRLTSHQKMWYLIGIENDAVKTYGLDRIIELTITKETFNGKLNPEVEKEIENYRNRIGVSMPLLKPYRPLKIEIGVSDFYLNYIKTKPIHFSQEITNKKIKGYNLVHLHLTPNIDFVKTIVSGVGDLKVFGPEIVVELIKDYLEKLK